MRTCNKPPWRQTQPRYLAKALTIMRISLTIKTWFPAHSIATAKHTIQQYMHHRHHISQQMPIGAPPKQFQATPITTLPHQGNISTSKATPIPSSPHLGSTSTYNMAHNNKNTGDVTVLSKQLHVQPFTPPTIRRHFNFQGGTQQQNPPILSLQPSCNYFPTIFHAHAISLPLPLLSLTDLCIGSSIQATPLSYSGDS